MTVVQKNEWSLHVPRLGRSREIVSRDPELTRALRNLVLVTIGVVTVVVAGTALYVRWKLG